MHTISLYQQREFSQDFFERYSKFKHGSKTQARYFGKLVADSIDFLSFPDLHGKCLKIYSAPFKNVPTASSAFTDYLVSYLTPQFIEHKIDVELCKITRKYSYDDDYGLMSKEEREKAISSDLFHIDSSAIEKEDILVLIDDIKITGAHLKRVEETLEKHSIFNPLVYICIAEYLGDEPAIESKLNHYSIKNLKDINDIIRNEEFIFNTRVIKYILKADIEEFVSFITYQSESFK